MKMPKLPFRLPEFDFSEVFSLSRKEALIAAAATGAALVAAVVITVVVISVRNRDDGKLRRQTAAAEYEAPVFLQEDKLFLSDFIIQEDRMKESFTGVIFSRTPAQKWSREEAEKYWVDPAVIASDHLEDESEKLIKDIFADVP